MSAAETDVLKTIIETLKPLTSDERRRTLEAALAFLGEGRPDWGATERNSQTRDAIAGASGDPSEATGREEPTR